jgi:hypothetical protein
LQVFLSLEIGMQSGDQTIRKEICEDERNQSSLRMNQEEELNGIRQSPAKTPQSPQGHSLQ